MKKNAIQWLLIVTLLLCSVLLGGCTPPPSGAQGSAHITKLPGMSKSVRESRSPQIWKDTLICILNDVLHIKSDTETKKWDDYSYKYMLLADSYVYLINDESVLVRIDLNTMEQTTITIPTTPPDSIPDFESNALGYPQQRLFYTNEKLYAIYTFDRHWRYHSIFEIDDDFIGYTLLQKIEDQSIERICGEYLFYNDTEGYYSEIEGNEFRNIYATRLDGTGEDKLFFDGNEQERDLYYYDENNFFYTDRDEQHYWLGDIKTGESKEISFKEIKTGYNFLRYNGGPMLLINVIEEEYDEHMTSYYYDIYYYDPIKRKTTYIYRAKYSPGDEILIEGDYCYFFSKNLECTDIDGEKHFVSELTKVHIPTRKTKVLLTESTPAD